MFRGLSLLSFCTFALTLAACGGSSSSPPPASVQTVSPSATPATAAATTKPTGTAVPNACAQTPAPATASTIAVVPYTTFTNELSAASTICFSAYVFTDASFSALDIAAKHGANETVILRATTISTGV